MTSVLAIDPGSAPRLISTCPEKIPRLMPKDTSSVFESQFRRKMSAMPSLLRSVTAASLMEIS